MVAVPLITAKGDFVAQLRDHEERIFDEHPVISITPLGLRPLRKVHAQHGTLQIVRNPAIEPPKLEVGINILRSDSGIWVEVAEVFRLGIKEL
jgi:hypothetical protein